MAHVHAHPHPKQNKITFILTELGHHMPYSIFGVTTAIMVMGFFTFIAHIVAGANAEHGHMAINPEAYEELFHIFHPAHVLFSSVTATAMFWKYEKKWLKAILIGSLGSIATCTLSDTLIPYAGGFFLGTPMHLHICVIDEPAIVWPFAIAGVLAGLFLSESIERSTQYSHAAHIFVSSMASIIYLIAFGLTDWTHIVGWVFLLTVVSVMLPCCLSDIAMPIFCTNKTVCNHKH